MEDMEEVLEVGSWNRVLGATAQNPDSSRSHCIFTIEFEICFTTEDDEHEQFRSGKHTKYYMHLYLFGISKQS